jgi:maltose alpha-D-glucosyltransferase/alpha-amylase
MLLDAMADRDFCRSLLQAIGQKRSFRGITGVLTASPTSAFGSIRGPADGPLEPVPMKVEQSNTSVVFGNRLILKLFRKLEEGINPDQEMGLFLTEKTDFSHISPLAGSLEYRTEGGKPMSVAILQGFVANEGDAWKFTLDSLKSYFREVEAHPSIQAPPVTRQHLLSLAEPPDLARETIGSYLGSAQLLGQRTAELHRALASSAEDPDFAPEPFLPMYQRSLYQSMRSFTLGTFQLLQQRLESLAGELREDARAVLEMEGAIMERFERVRQKTISASRIRCHGDYHLGQVLYTGKDFTIIDFEGEPARSLSERRFKRSPLQDVAGMLRSFHYASYSALLQRSPHGPRPEDERLRLGQWAQFWYIWVAAAYLTSYLGVIRKARLLPEDPQQLKILLDAYLLEKAVYEIGYELNNRPDWVTVPLRGILSLMAAT